MSDFKCPKIDETDAEMQLAVKEEIQSMIVEGNSKNRNCNSTGTSEMCDSRN